MREQLAATVAANLRFYRRSRLLLAIAVIFVVLPALGSIPTFFIMSANLKFEFIRTMVSRACGAASFLAAALGILTIHHHLGTRCYRMVVTKPCRPEVWLLAHYASGMLVAAVLLGAGVLATASLFLLWGIPFQWGLAFVALDQLGQILVLFSAVSFLTVMVHPVVAVMAVAVLREGTFHLLAVWTSLGAASAHDALKRLCLEGLSRVLGAVYYVLPAGEPFGKQLQTLYSSYRAGLPEAGWVGAGLLYALLVAALFYTLGVYALRRRRLV